MKWINHEILTGVTIYAVTDNPLFAIFGMAGAILPDKLEGNPQQLDNYWSWRSRHRGWSHWAVPYLLIIAVILIVERWSLSGLDVWDMSVILLYIMVGAVLHILQDAVCGKVPIITPWHKGGIRLFTVGSFSEYLFAIAYILVMYILYIKL